MLSSSSSITSRVEKATSDLLNGPDWTMNMDICDSVNSDYGQAKDVVKAVKKRLQHKNPRVQFFALTLLETVMKNCGEYVHSLVAEREILQEMVKIVRKKTDMQVRGKILVLLDSWQEAFGGPNGKFPQYYWAYAELRKSGVPFPKPTADAVPIFTPPVTHPTFGHPPTGYGMPSNSSIRLDEAMASEVRNLRLSDLDSIRSVMELLRDMLEAVNLKDPGAVKDEVIADLVSQCRSNQKKIMELINTTGDEELLGQGLELNDNLQNLIEKHDAIASGHPLPAAPETAKASESVCGASASSIPEPIKADRLDNEHNEDDDDFSQLARRNVKVKPVPSQSSAAEAGDRETSSQWTNETIVTTPPNITEGSSSASSNSLALVDPPIPVEMDLKEQNMIDLLSLTLSTNPSPPQTPPQPSVYNGSGSQALEQPQTAGSQPDQSNQHPHPANQQPYPANQQPYPVSQHYTAYNSYVVPWAQQTSSQPLWQPQAPVQQQVPSYPPPPWATPQNYGANNIPSTAYQYPPYTNNVVGYIPPSHSPIPLQKLNSFGGGNSINVSQPLQHQISFPSRGNTSQSMPKGAQPDANAKPTGPSAANKPFIPSYRLFEDLVDLKSGNGGAKTGSSSADLSSSVNQSMIKGRK